MPKIAEYILKLEVCDAPSLRRPTHAVKPIVKMTNKKKLGALSFNTSLLRLRNCSFSLSKVILEFLLTIYGTSRIVVHEVIKLRYLSFKKNASFHPSTVKTKNIRFQKLSLFSLDCRKLILGFFGLSYIPPYSLGIVDEGTTSFCGLELSFKLKSSMVIICNLWFQIYRVIVSVLYRFFKQILSLMLLVSLVLCGNSVVVLASANTNVSYSENNLSALIASAEKTHQIPSGLLAAIAKVESNTKAYALNIDGKPVLEKSLQDASRAVRHKLGTGIKNIDVGVMQLNYRWHGSEFNNITQMLIPENNIKYAASLLKSLKIKHGTWHKAIKYYHSATPEHHKKYSRKVLACWLVRDRTGEQGRRLVVKHEPV